MPCRSDIGARSPVPVIATVETDRSAGDTSILVDLIETNQAAHESGSCARERLHDFATKSQRIEGLASTGDPEEANVHDRFFPEPVP